MKNGCSTVAWILFLVIGVSIFYIHSIIVHEPLIPSVKDQWWGKLDVDIDENIYPFGINISEKVLRNGECKIRLPVSLRHLQCLNAETSFYSMLDKSTLRTELEVLEDLRFRLENTKQPTTSLQSTFQNYGISSTVMSHVVNFWLNEYDWRKRERFLNKFPQFKTRIQGLDIHFLHIKPKVSDDVKVFPLLLIHGWPGSVREFYDIIPLLSTPQKERDFVFEIVAPSLPGFGFSDAAIKPGLGVVQMGVILKILMVRLNLHKFFVQGGDWGAIMAPHISILFPKNVIGMHSNMCASIKPISLFKRLFYSVFPPLIVEKKYEHSVYPLSDYLAGFMEEMGYFHLQTTKPDTIGVALSDSPYGLAAYILEKFVSWTDPNWKQLDDGGLMQKFKMEDLLDNVMIYWVTNTITTSMRIYAESYNKNMITWDLERNSVPVPAACARFSNDIEWNPKALIDDKFQKLLQLNDYIGGHFAAFENPEILAEDIFMFAEKVINDNYEFS